MCILEFRGRDPGRNKNESGKSCNLPFNPDVIFNS